LADGWGDSLHRKASDDWAGGAAAWESGVPSPGSFGPRVLFDATSTETIIGEVGRVTTLTHVPQVVQLNQAYNNPVVFAQPASFLDADPVVVRITDVQSNQFSVFLAEPSNLDGIHDTEESVSYVVLEAGSHWLADRTHLEVGTVFTDATVSRTLNPNIWDTVNFTSLFSNTPVVLSQVQTARGEDYLTTRQRLTTIDSFQVALEPEELVDTQQGVETVGYLAIDQTFSFWNGMAFQADRLDALFKHNFFPIQFDQLFPTAPNFLASLASYNEAYNANLLFNDLRYNSFEVKIEEETTLDEEVKHNSREDLAYVAISGSGPLTAMSGRLADGLTQTFSLNIVDNGMINDLDVRIELVHTRVGDLDVFLEGPDGTSVELLTDIGNASDNLIATILNDEALKSFFDGEPPFSGEFQPEGSLLDFDGKSLTGTWLLHVTDDTANRDTGTLVEWSLDFELAPVLVGNLNHDSRVDATDIDMLFANFGSSDPLFDLNNDGDLNSEDVNHLVLNNMGKQFGDADLD